MTLFNGGPYYVGEWFKDQFSDKGCFHHPNGTKTCLEFENGKLVYSEDVPQLGKRPHSAANES